MSKLPQTKEFLLTIMLFFSLVLNFAVMVFKKLKKRKKKRVKKDYKQGVKEQGLKIGFKGRPKKG